MPDLLLELRSEEIPARMQRKAAGDLRKLVTNALVDAGLTYEGAQEYWTARRLTLDVRGVTAKSADIREERKGPRTDAPQKAVEGFLRGAGLSRIEDAKIASDPKKGDFYVAVIEKPGRLAEEIIAETMPAIIRDFPWPKSMRWGKASARPGALRWVRPLQSILCTFGPETEEPVIVDFEVDGIRSGNVTYGHRFHAPGPIKVRRFDDYAEKLTRAKVVLDGERRKQIIAADAKNLAFASGLELVEDEALLEEVAGLVEWPVVLMGVFEEAFLDIPPEVVRLTIKANQKCFVLRPQGGGGLSNRFILVSNIEAKDGGAEIARGNGKVVRARLSDALYFWQADQGDLPDLDTLKPSAEKFGLDLDKPLDQRMAKLDNLGVTFHAKLGTQGERVERIRRLARELAPIVGADPDKADRAAVLAKADLTTEAVGEFPELQGLMGRRYAELQGEDPQVSAAIEDHYKPLGPTDTVPRDPVTIAVALADKLDMLVGFWAIDEKPTGSKDPYALRRAALGVIRLVLENGVRLSLLNLAYDLLKLFWDAVEVRPDHTEKTPDLLDHMRETLRLPEYPYFIRPVQTPLTFDGRMYNSAATAKYVSYWLNMQDLLSFFHDRLKVYLRDQGTRHDLIDAVLTAGRLAPASGENGGSDDLLAVTQRVSALGELLDTEDGKNLLAGTKRAANILAAEEKKGTRIADRVDASLFRSEEEERLLAAVNGAEKDAAQAIEKEDYSSAMRALASLRQPIDAFFDEVLVNDEDERVRANRLALLDRIRSATAEVADFSRIAG